jgi:lysyl-tRNA synthetase class II
MGRRDMGKATFLDLQDGSGRIQVLLRQNQLGDDLYEALRLIDLGDFVGAKGIPMRTRTGQPTVGATSWVMLAKALRSPPEKYHGLTDAEARRKQVVRLCVETSVPIYNGRIDKTLFVRSVTAAGHRLPAEAEEMLLQSAGA